MTAIHNIPFCGSETAGSAAYSQNVKKSSSYKTYHTNFKGHSNSKESEGNNSAIKIIGIGSIAAIAGFVGLAYAHKYSAFDKISNEQIKNAAKKLEPASKKCYEWCSEIKKNLTNLWHKKS